MVSESKSAGGSPGAQGSGEAAFHATYSLDLTNPTQAELEGIKDSVVRRVQESLQHEIDSLGKNERMKSTYDKHSSLHDSG